MKFVLVATIVMILLDLAPDVFSKKLSLLRRVTRFVVVCLVLYVTITSFLIGSQKALYDSSSGRLNGVFDGIQLRKIFIQTGGAGAYFKDSIPDITVGGESVFEGADVWIDNESNSVKMSVVIRDQSRNVLARIEGNEWQVNKNRIFDRNFDSRGVEVVREDGEVVFQSNFVGFEKLDDGTYAGVVSFKGVFYDRAGNCFVFGVGPPGGEGLALAKVIGRGGPVEQTGIPRLFKYPSEQYPGQRLK